MPLRESVYPKHIAVPWVLKSRAWLAPGGIQPANHNHVKTKMPLQSRFINLEYYSESLCSSLMSFKSLVSRSCGSTSSGARCPRGSHRLPSTGSGASPVAGWRPNAWSSTPAAPLGWTSWPGTCRSRCCSRSTARSPCTPVERRPTHVSGCFSRGTLSLWFLSYQGTDCQRCSGRI